MKPPSQRYLYLTVFASGLTTLGIEMSASRLLGAVFGTSNAVWANIIGLILLYLTAGYFLGGRIADRSPKALSFYRVIAWGAFTAGLVPIIAHPVLQFAARAILNVSVPVVVGSFGAVLILFAVPVTLLGAVSPFAIRLAIQDTESAGRVSGRMYAISTIGSIIGTFLPVLVLIPTIGTNMSFLLLAGMLLVLALIGLARASLKEMLKLIWMPCVLIALAAVFLRGPMRPLPSHMKLLYEDESAYNYIQVVRLSQANILMLNEGQAIHSIYYPEAPDFLETGGQWDFFLAAPFFNAPPFRPSDVRSMAQVGLAGGTIAKQYTAVFGPIPIDGIEIDPDIVEVGRRYFGMTEPNLNVIIQDGRYALASSPRMYDVIGVDAYRMPYVPWHLTTVEFFQAARDHLTERGVVVINAGRTVNDRRVVDAFAVTLQRVFASVHVMDIPRSCNSVLVATVQPTVPENLLANLKQLPSTAHPFLFRMLELSYKQLRPTSQEGMLFTDDQAAVELLTDSILVNFALSGNTALPCQ